jgi:glutamyl/glutaminyl-tRNA synthetase
VDEPRFVHLGVVLGPDGKKLSKRHGDAGVADFRREGYLPEALLNYLALLGWNHPAGEEEFAGLEELVREWDPSRLGARPATFDADRLLSLNARHLRRLTAEELRWRFRPFLEELLPPGRELVAVEAVREEMRVLSDGPRLLREITDPVDPASFAGELPGSSEEVLTHAIEKLEDQAPDDLEDARDFVAGLRTWAKERGVKTRDLFHPLRLALTGRDRGPGMAYLFAVLGPQETKARIERAREARLRT